MLFRAKFLLAFALLASQIAHAEPGTFRLRMVAEPQSLDWNLASSSNETHIIMNLMEGLVQHDDKMNVIPALAKSWKISKDMKTYTFTLRKNITWTDGEPLKAKHFIDSWIRVLLPGTKAPFASFLFDIVNAKEFYFRDVKLPKKLGFRAIDDYTIEIKTKRVVPYFLHMFTFWATFPIRKDIIKKHGKSLWTGPGRIVTLGPYLLKAWKRGKQIVLKRNPNYYADKPSVETVLAVIETNDRLARNLFRMGKLDALLGVTTKDIIEFRGKGGIQVKQFPYLATYYLGFNTRKYPFNNFNVRKAFVLSVDRSKIPSILQGGQTPATGWLPPGMQGHGLGPKLKFSPYEAGKALIRGGYRDISTFPGSTIYVEKFDGAKRFGKFMSESLSANLNVPIKSVVLTPKDYRRLRDAGSLGIFVGHWGADYPDPANFFEVFSSSSSANPTNWKNDRYDRYMVQARNSLDMSKRLNEYAGAETILQVVDSVILPLFYMKNTALLSHRVKKFQLNPLNYLFFKKIRLDN